MHCHRGEKVFSLSCQFYFCAIRQKGFFPKKSIKGRGAIDGVTRLKNNLSNFSPIPRNWIFGFFSRHPASRAPSDRLPLFPTHHTWGKGGSLIAPSLPPREEAHFTVPPPLSFSQTVSLSRLKNGAHFPKYRIATSKPFPTPGNFASP